MVGVAVGLGERFVAVHLDTALAQQMLGVIEAREHFQDPVGELHRPTPEVVVVIKGVRVVPGHDQLPIQSIGPTSHPLDGVGDLVLVQQHQNPLLQRSTLFTHGFHSPSFLAQPPTTPS